MLSGLLLTLSVLVPADLAQDPAADFTKRFDRAMAVSDQVEMDRAIKKYREAALNKYLEKVAVVKWSDPWMQGFSLSWKRVHRSEFPRIYGEYLDALEDDKQIVRNRGIQGLMPMYAQNTKAVASREPKDWIHVVEVIEGSGVLLDFMDCGDKYYQTICLNFLANAYNTDFQDGGGDDFQAYKVVEQFLKLRQELDYTNDLSFTNLERMAVDLRAKLGIDEPKKPGEDKEPKASPYRIKPAEGAEWVEVPLEFYMEKKPGALTLPIDTADLDPDNWPYLAFGKAGDSVAFPPAYSGEDCFFAGPNGPVKLTRIKATKFVIEAGGEPSEDFSIGLKPKVVTFEQKMADGSLVQQALMVAGGSETGNIHGVQVNKGFNENGGIMFFRMLSGRTGKSPFGVVTLFDTDRDALYGRNPLRVAGSVAMPLNVYLLRFDSMTLGKMKSGMPVSKWVRDAKGTWYELELPQDPACEMLRIRQVAPTLGELKVTFKGVKGLSLESLVLRAETSQLAGLYVDVAGKGPHQLPIGRYQVLQGLLRGKDGQESLIQPPTDVPFVVYVEPEQTSELELGAPFHLIATPQVDAGKVSVDPETLRIVGRNGETYMMNIGGPLFDIKVDIKGGKSFEMGQPSQDDVGADWHLAFFPASAYGDAPKGKPVLVRLSMKKHPWFGKLTSDWIEP